MGQNKSKEGVPALETEDKSKPTLEKAKDTFKKANSAFSISDFDAAKHGYAETLDILRLVSEEEDMKNRPKSDSEYKDVFFHKATSNC